VERLALTLRLMAAGDAVPWVDSPISGHYSQNDHGGVMTRMLSAARAKAEFAECVRRAEAGDAVVITRHGKAVAALVGAERLKELERMRAAGPREGLAGLAGGWKGSEALVKTVLRLERSQPRRTPRRSR
jgi:prevent-host-death family protein